MLDTQLIRKEDLDVIKLASAHIRKGDMMQAAEIAMDTLAYDDQLSLDEIVEGLVLYQETPHMFDKRSHPPSEVDQVYVTKAKDITEALANAAIDGTIDLKGRHIP